MNNRPKAVPVVFRADSSARIGHGHVLRCLALADGLARRGMAPAFLSRAEAGNAFPAIRRGGVALEEMPSGLPLEAELAWVRERLAERPVVVTDSYEIGERYQKELRPLARLMVAVDDLADRRLDCDILINQNPHAEPSLYRDLLPPGARPLLGPRYALLRPEFRDAEPRPRPGAVREVLVTLGGSDPDNATLLVLRGLARAARGSRVTVALGGGNPHEGSIRAFAAESGLEIEVLRDAPDMPALMRRADFAVSAAGVTCWELARLGVPAALVTLAPNQRPGAARLAELGAFHLLGERERLTPERLATELEPLLASPERRAALSRASAALVDGRGVDRICDEILERIRMPTAGGKNG